jgi:hypothetical protein
MSIHLHLPAPDGVLEFVDEDGKTSAPAWTEASIRAAFARATQPTDATPGAHAQGQNPDERIRVACIRLGLITLYAEGKTLHALGIGEEGDDEVYTLTFKTITRAEFDALGEFDGF